MKNILDRGRTGVIAACCLCLAACSQGEGESCQISADCEDGLICERDEGSRGQCVDPDEVDPDTRPDGAMMDPELPPDEVMQDAAVDAGADAATDAGIDAALDEDASLDEDDAG